MCSCVATWNIRSFISLIQHGLWPPNLAKWWLTLWSFHPQSYKTFWTRGHVRLCDKLKLFVPLLQYLKPPNLAGLLYSMSSFPLWSERTLWSRNLTRSRDKSNILHLYYHNHYGYQIWQGSSMQWGASFGKVTNFHNQRGYATSRDKLYTLYLYYHKTSGH